MLQTVGDQLQGVILHYMISQYLYLYWITSTGKVAFDIYCQFDLRMLHEYDVGRHLCVNSFFNINPTSSFKVILILNSEVNGMHLNKGMNGILACLFPYELF
jgi:hypothetical protein